MDALHVLSGLQRAFRVVVLGAAATALSVSSPEARTALSPTAQEPLEATPADALEREFRAITKALRKGRVSFHGERRLRQLRRQAEPCRPATGNQHVYRVRQRRMRAAIAAARCGAANVRVATAKPIQIELHLTLTARRRFGNDICTY